MISARGDRRPRCGPLISWSWQWVGTSRDMLETMTTPASEGGDPACWLGEVCTHCGRVIEGAHDCVPEGALHLGRVPDGLELARITDPFDERSVPAGLLRTHRVAAGVWGRLVVDSGSLGFRFEDDDGNWRVSAGEWIVIPPGRPHRVELAGPVRFAVEFHRLRGAGH